MACLHRKNLLRGRRQFCVHIQKFHYPCGSKQTTRAANNFTMGCCSVRPQKRKRENIREARTCRIKKTKAGEEGNESRGHHGRHPR